MERFAHPYREHAYSNEPWVTAVIDGDRYSGYREEYTDEIQLLSVDDADGLVRLFNAPEWMCEVLIFDYSQPFDQQEYDHLVEKSVCRGLSSRKRVTHVIRVSPSGRLSVESFADPYREHAYANVPWVTAVIGSKRYSGYMVAYANHIQLLSVDDADGCVCLYSEFLEGWMCEVLIIDYSQPFDQQEYDRLFQESTPNDGFVTTPGEAMTASGAERSTSRLAGYAALTERYGVEVIPNWHASRVAAGTTHHIDSHAGIVEEVFPAWYWPGDRLGDQLEFALKHDGTNLAILAALFRGLWLAHCASGSAAGGAGAACRCR